MINLLGGLAGQIIGLFGERGRANQAVIKERLAQMERSYTDEVIIAYWFGPTIVSIFGWAAPLINQKGMITENTEIFAVQTALTAAVFGLGKMNGRNQNKD